MALKTLLVIFLLISAYGDDSTESATTTINLRIFFFIIIEINITDINPQIVTYNLLSNLKAELHCSVVKTESITNSVIDEISNNPTNIVSVPLNEVITVKSSLLDENTEYSIMCTFPPNVFNLNNYPYQQLNFKTLSYISQCPEDGCGFGRCDSSNITCYCDITSEYNYQTGKCDYEKYNIIIELYYNTIEDDQTINYNNKLYSDITTIFSSLYNISINRVNVVKVYNSYIQMKILSYGKIEQLDIMNGIDLKSKSSNYIVNKFVNDVYNNNINIKTLFDIISEKYNRSYTINKSIKPNIYTEDICEPIVTLSEKEHLFHFDLSDGSPSILSHNFSIISYNCPLMIYDIRTITGDKDLALEDNIITIEPSLHSFVLQPNEKFYISVTVNPVPIKEFQLFIEHSGVNGYSVVSYYILKGALGYEYNVDYGWNKWVYYFGTDPGIYWFVASIVIIILAEIVLYFLYRICVAFPRSIRKQTTAEKDLVSSQLNVQTVTSKQTQIEHKKYKIEQEKKEIELQNTMRKAISTIGPDSITPADIQREGAKYNPKTNKNNGFMDGLKTTADGKQDYMYK